MVAEEINEALREALMSKNMCLDTDPDFRTLFNADNQSHTVEIKCSNGTGAYWYSEFCRCDFQRTAEMIRDALLLLAQTRRNL